MKVIHVLRKPCSEGTVAANVLRWGTGALNIDACRLSFASEADEAESKTKNQHADFGTAPLTGNVTYGDYSMVPPKNYNPPGRWPANLVLQHLDGCVQDGTRSVTGQGHYPASRPRGSQVSGPAGHIGQQDLPESRLRHETITAWTCAPGCPVAAFDQQSGVSKSPVTTTRGAGGRNGRYGPILPAQGKVFAPGDTGGASRFFKQVKP